MNRLKWHIGLVLLCAGALMLPISCGDDDNNDDNNDMVDDDDNDDVTDDDVTDDDITDDDVTDDDTTDDDVTDDDTGDDDTTLPEGPGGFDPDYRTSSDFFTQMSGLTIGQEGIKVQIWYSSNIAPLIGLTGFTVPFGTTAIQEVDNDNDDVVNVIGVMVKMGDGYDPENNNWYYETREPDGTLRSSPPPGRIQSCIECHQDFPETDFLGGTQLR